jgi:hypothetical protein
LSELAAAGAWMPARPEVAPEHHAAQASPLRYEDLAQDGRVMLTSLPHAVGVVVWKNLERLMPAAEEAFAAGVVPLLTRLVCEGSDERMSPRDQWQLEGCAQLSHHLRAGDDESQRRIFCNVWTSARGPRGRVHGAPLPGDGAEVLMGRCFAEHTFARPFAPPGQRRLSRLAIAGWPEIPAPTYAFEPPADRLELPAGAIWLDALAAEGSATVFGLMHTDSNQHVNSLVYPRLFEEACLARFARLGRSPAVLARRLDVAYRKPAFAGEAVQVVLRVFTHEDLVGAVGAILPARAELASVEHAAHCFLRMLFW